MIKFTLYSKMLFIRCKIPNYVDCLLLLNYQNVQTEQVIGLNKSEKLPSERSWQLVDFQTFTLEEPIGNGFRLRFALQYAHIKDVCTVDKIKVLKDKNLLVE